MVTRKGHAPTEQMKPIQNLIKFAFEPNAEYNANTRVSAPGLGLPRLLLLQSSGKKERKTHILRE